MRLTIEGGAGNDELTLRVNNLGDATSPIAIELDGGAGRDLANVTPGIDTAGW